jgi:methionyl-tRNA formyltransferase
MHQRSYPVSKIVLCGVQQQGIDTIQYLWRFGIKVTHVVTTSIDMATDDSWVPYYDTCKRLGIHMYIADTYELTSPDDEAFFLENKFDVLIFGGWQRLISAKILESIKYPIGQHGSPEFLPKGRGRSPLNWAIIHGNKRLVWNLFLLKPGVDDGDVIDHEIIEIRDSDDCNTLYYKVSVVVKNMLRRSIPKLISDRIDAFPQTGLATYFEKRTPADGRIHWSQSVYDVHNLIRGVTHPYPGAFTTHKDQKIMVWKAQVWDTVLDYYQAYNYGEIVEVFDTDFAVKCYEGILLVTSHDDDNIYIGKHYV